MRTGKVLSLPMTCSLPDTETAHFNMISVKIKTFGESSQKIPLCINDKIIIGQQDRLSQLKQQNY